MGIPHLSLPTPGCLSCQPGDTCKGSTTKEQVFCMEAIKLAMRLQAMRW